MSKSQHLMHIYLFKLMDNYILDHQIWKDYYYMIKFITFSLGIIEYGNGDGC